MSKRRSADYLRAGVPEVPESAHLRRCIVSEHIWITCPHCGMSILVDECEEDPLEAHWASGACDDEQERTRSGATGPDKAPAKRLSVLMAGHATVTSGRGRLGHLLVMCLRKSSLRAGLSRN